MPHHRAYNKTGSVIVDKQAVLDTDASHLIPYAHPWMREKLGGSSSADPDLPSRCQWRTFFNNPQKRIETVCGMRHHHGRACREPHGMASHPHAANNDKNVANRRERHARAARMSPTCRMHATCMP